MTSFLSLKLPFSLRSPHSNFCNHALIAPIHFVENISTHVMLPSESRYFHQERPQTFRSKYQCARDFTWDNRSFHQDRPPRHSVYNISASPPSACNAENCEDAYHFWYHVNVCPSLKLDTFPWHRTHNLFEVVSQFLMRRQRAQRGNVFNIYLIFLWIA